MYGSCVQGYEQTRHLVECKSQFARSLFLGGGVPSLGSQEELPSAGGRIRIFGIYNNKKTNKNEKLVEQIELPAKLLDYFLRSNKSNINQNKQTSKQINKQTTKHVSLEYPEDSHQLHLVTRRNCPASLPAGFNDCYGVPLMNLVPQNSRFG